MEWFAYLKRRENLSISYGRGGARTKPWGTGRVVFGLAARHQMDPRGAARLEMVGVLGEAKRGISLSQSFSTMGVV